MTITAICCAVIGCNNIDSPESKQTRSCSNQTNGYELLLSNIISFNDQYFGTSHKNTRSDTGQAMKADFQRYDGKGVGICISISASRKKYKELKSQPKTNIDTQSPEAEQIRHKIDSLMVRYRQNPNNAGALHNAGVLTCLLNNKFNESTSEEIVRSSVDALISLGISSLKNVNIKEMAMGLDDFFTNIYDDNSATAFARMQKLDPTSKDQYDVIINYISNVENMHDLEMIRDYSDKFISVVRESSIPETDKDLIEQHISIAPASIELWEWIETL